MDRIKARGLRWLLPAFAASAVLAAIWNADLIHRLVADRWRGAHAAAESPYVAGPVSAAYRSASADSVPPRFSFEQTWSSPVSAMSLATGDFNGDGRDDLAAMAAATSDYSAALDLNLFLQQGDGSLAPPIVLPFPGGLHNVLGMATGDLNGDGLDDIAISQRDHAALYYLLSQAGGGFAWRVDDWSTGFPWGPAHVGDMDGDGHLDVVMLVGPPNIQTPTDNPGQVVTYFGDGSGDFPRHGSELTSQLPFDTALGQLNGDARPDFLAAPLFSHDHRPLVHRNDGLGGWLPPTRLGFAPDQYFRGAAVFDLTADGRDDAVVISNTSPSRISIYPQLVDGSLATQATVFAAGGYSTFTGQADLNGDGRIDLVHLDEGSDQPRFFYYLPDAHGLGYPIAQVLPVADNPNQFLASDLAIGDFNHDGVADVAIASRYHQLRVWSGKLTPFAGSGGLPGAPSVLQVRDPFPLDPWPRHTAEVTVGAALDDGGNAITGYTVYSVPGGAIDVDAGSPAGVHRVQWLDTGNSYVFYARASNAAGMGPPSPNSAPLVIGTPEDPNALPVLSFAADEFKETDVGPRTIEIRGTLDKPAPVGGARFDVATSDGTATAGVDYVAFTLGDVSIPEGEWVTPPILLTVLGDQELEEDESLHLVLSDLHGITAGNSTPTVGIYDDDRPEATIGMNIPVVVEGDAGAIVVTLTVKISRALPNDVVFNMGTGSTSAQAGVDYQHFRHVGLRIPAGQTSLQVPFTVYGDTVFEAEESVGVSLSQLEGGVVDGESDISIRIIDNDPAPTLSVADAAMEEGNQGDDHARFRVQLMAPMPHDVSFSAVTQDGSAKAGSDYVSRYQGGIVIRAGETIADVYVKLLPDTRLEPDEIFSLRLENPAGVAIADGTGVATLVNDDVANGIAVDDASVAEGGVAKFVVRLSEPAAQAVGFDAWTSTGTAFDGVDFPALRLTGLVIPAGSTSLVVDVPTTADAEVEDNETFVLNLSNVSGATLSDAQGKGRILNDDLATLSIGDVSVVEGSDDGATSVYFEVQLSRPMPTPVSFVVFPAEGGTANWNDTSGPAEHAYEIDPGRTRLRFEMRVWGDSDFEPDETFLIELTQAWGAVLGDSIGQGTIINDDAEPAAARLSRRGR